MLWNSWANIQDASNDILILIVLADIMTYYFAVNKNMVWSGMLKIL